MANVSSLNFDSRLDEFHYIQDLALAGNFSLAADQLQELLASKPWKTSQVPMDWWNYLKATLAYFRSDLDKLIKLQTECDINRDVVIRLVEGLSKHGSVDYRRDYVVD